MEKRSTESPMDFEWQTHGPADSNSPFTKHTMSYHESQKDPQLKKRKPHVSRFYAFIFS